MKNLEQQTFDYYWSEKEDPLIISLLLIGTLMIWGIEYWLNFSFGIALMINIIILGGIYITKLYQIRYSSKKHIYQKKYLEHMLEEYEENTQYHYNKMKESIEKKEETRSELISLMKLST